MNSLNNKTKLYFRCLVVVVVLTRDLIVFLQSWLHGPAIYFTIWWFASVDGLFCRASCLLFYIHDGSS